MKRNILQLAITIFLLTSCNNNSRQEKNDRPIKRSFNAGSANAISLDSAKHFINAYGMYWDSVAWIAGNRDSTVHAPIVRAFTISSMDLIQLLGFGDDSTLWNSCVFKSVRAYMGFKGNGDDSTYHLFLTPIADSGKDTILISTGQNGGSNRYVFDLTTPCPNTCDKTSDLYKALTIPKQHK